MIAGLLLAAGFGRRFGGDKLTADLHGKPVVRWCADALGAVAEELIAVVPENDTALRAILAMANVQFAENAERDEGMASSIRTGVRSLPRNAEAVLIALGDQPYVRAAVIAALVDSFRQGGADAVIPVYRGVRGHPVLFSRACFDALAGLSGDSGARLVLEELGVGCREIAIDDDVPIDVDSWQDLEILRRQKPWVSRGEAGDSSVAG